MASKKVGSLQRWRPSRCRPPLLTLLLLSVAAPLLFWAARIGNINPSSGQLELSGTSSSIIAGDQQKLNALDQIEKLFPKEMIDAIVSAVDDSGPLSLNVIGRKDLSSSWVLEDPVGVTKDNQDIYKTSFNESKHDAPFQSDRISELAASEEQESLPFKDQLNARSKAENLEIEWKDIVDILNGTTEVFNNTLMERDSPARVASRKMRIEQKEKRLVMLTQDDPFSVADEHEKEVAKQTKPIDAGIFGKYSIWRQEFDTNSDSLVRLMKDQLIMARVYEIIAQSHNDINLLQDLRFHIKESQQVLGEAIIDKDLPQSAAEKIKSMGQMISKGRERYNDCKEVTKKLRAFLQSTENRSRMLKKHATFLSQLAAKAIPKVVHCLSLRLTIEFSLLPEERRNFPNKENLEDPNLFHYALFSDNVLAASVVVKSTVLNAKEPEKHVLHIVTDKLNYGAMRMWFLANSPGNATIEVQNVDDFKWLNSTYCPVLRQLESSVMKEYYFKSGHPTTLADGSSNLKYRNPKYLSMLNHLRFYLPEVYPKLDKILFLDDDIVVQKDLTSLWSVDLNGKVNGAVETCGESFHRFDKYLNFSNPLISKNFDPSACGWAYGMNIFDLREWKRKDITGIYHKWQNKNEDRLLWKLGTLPPGLITFYNLTHPLEKSWHVLGLGYNPSVDKDEIDGAAVIHYNGNMKPWLELSMAKYKPYWTKYVNYDSVFLKQCSERTHM